MSQQASLERSGHHCSTMGLSVPDPYIKQVAQLGSKPCKFGKGEQDPWGGEAEDLR